MLIDSGSELSFISESTVSHLNLTRHHSNISIIGIGATNSGNTRGVVSITLKSIHSSKSISLHAYVLSKLSSTLPTTTLPSLKWSHLQNIPLADPDYTIPMKVDLIIGADVYAQIIQPDIIKGPSSTPMAQLTIFGWVILGPTDGNSIKEHLSHHLIVDQQLDDLQDLLTKFWTQEEVPTKEKDQLTTQELECEEHFKATYSRDSKGKYIIRLPISSSPSQLGDSFFKAQRCLHRLFKRFSTQGLLKNRYFAFLTEYEADGHMVKAPPRDSSLTTYYLPHHGIIREQSTTTKLRVVFNGSSPSTSGASLNSILHTGEKLQKDISDILLWVRRFRYIFSTDITKMFRQIKVHPDDWDLQRIIWVDSNNKEISYQLTTVTYGTKSAPFLAVRVLLQLIQDEGYRFPLAVPVLLNGRYMDDIYGGSDEVSELKDIAKDLIDLLNSGGFPLAKWQSNHPDFFDAVTRKGDLNSHLIDHTQTKVLGLSWFPRSDEFKFSFEPTSLPGQGISKRSILSEVSQLFDPLGFLSPVIIRAKMLLQELWLEKLGWDDPLSEKLSSRWIKFKEELAQLPEISIPRWLNLTSTSTTEIHGFSDASQLAMAAVVFLKTSEPNQESKVTFVCAKTKVAPLKRLTIPRLELSAAQLLARLVNYVQRTLELCQVPVFLWTDSSVALTWINSHPSRWKEFVHNRVSSIHDLVPQGQWRFIKGKENPADCASRGLSIQQLSQHHLWWNGPPWLKDIKENWPSSTSRSDSSAQVEERPGLTFTVTTSHPQLWDLIHQYSDLHSLLKITSICLRFLAILKRIPNSSLANPIGLKDLDLARTLWIKNIQVAYFSADIKDLNRGTKFSRSHPLSKLNPFIDHQGILRVGGRLKHSSLDYESKHPAILPKDSPLTRLLIADAHSRTLHGGTQLTLTHLRNSYWIIGGRQPVRSFILKCIPCARQRGIRAQQLMGQLPLERITPSRPFLTSGVDYAGPITLKSWTGRGAKTKKGWICLFVCFSSSALHLEVVTDYSTNGFLAAYRRFVSRRGICQTLYSDCGTNFIGADTTLKQLFKDGSQEAKELSQLLIKDGTSWKFNPPAAPHMGGKWEAAVKSIKYHLRRTIGETILTYEEFTTLLTQIEAVLNSRPLEPLTEDPDDLSVLTPGHFLIGEPLTSIPEPSLLDLKTSRLTRWKLIQQQAQFFWAKWSTCYLQQQLAISKWHHPTHQIKVGSLVLLTDERFPPSKWPLARVTALHPGKDGLTRVVSIKTATTHLKRPITKLAVLPISTEEALKDNNST
ncbi:uncharacterized protein LOC127280387 [Leptopilina boulardi]|uniref:uncharacterized protein LOC127280387 n=1 Tax=Leptopilina boulardi TaxID=63433 RepID=UPI0021F503D4|nr:uncharacterized protein LOC127280387 [Leptopilina boulardi]